ncbi:MAG TPA: GspH/FimT family pseudopilin [Thermodesulfovibrionia bacterium]|nr:GspH/FimT family pseudopilin [Thermodesulfovibrionia bacterium]
MNINNNKYGFTLVELLVTLAIIAIVASIGVPEITNFGSSYKVRSASTDLLQNMRLAKAMAVKENREYLIIFESDKERYLIGHDGDEDGNLTTVGDAVGKLADTFGACKDTNNDLLPDTDKDANNDGIPDCVKLIKVDKDYKDVVIGFGDEIPPNGPNNSAIPDSGDNFGQNDVAFRADGSVDGIGSVYFQHVGKAYTYCVRISNYSGLTNLWRWDGDEDNPTKTEWTEIR